MKDYQHAMVPLLACIMLRSTHILLHNIVVHVHKQRRGAIVNDDDTLLLLVPQFFIELLLNLHARS